MTHSWRRLPAGFTALVIILFTLPVSAFTSWNKSAQEETLYWSAAHRLQFADFRGRPGKNASPGSVHEHGRIAGTIIKSIVADSRRIRGNMYFVVFASMKPGQSWITKKGDSTALRHEQGHFDICEIFARRLRSEIGRAASVDEAKEMWNRVLDEEEIEQTQYDKANTYLAGGITRAWQKKIRTGLQELEGFSRPEVAAAKLK